jgi:hypothetical protein
MSKVVETPGPLETPCLIWTSTQHRGYGWFKHRRAHKVYWEHKNKQFVPPGKELAHECKTKLCVLHVRPLTHEENLVEDSGKERQTHCFNGHEMTPENTYVQPGRPSNRVCKKCRRERERERDRRKRRGE